jgi:predicted O-methyltransferase YrrM
MGFNDNEFVKIDVVHAYFLYGLVLSHKPEKILELGIGGGRSLDAILQASKTNSNNVSITVVDNWIDWGGTMPEDVNAKYKNDIKLITSNEKDFIFSTKEKYDFIMSDADHHHTDEWFEYVYDNILEQNGILIYHDINLIEDSFINLRSIYKKCKERDLHHYLFNKNSLPYERCQRGLLVIFKNK